jgi:host factor-I protein
MAEEGTKRKMEHNTFNIQDSYFAKLRRDRTVTTIYLVNGVKLIGKIKSFDKYSILIENNHQEQLIFKHAISTITYSRTSFHRPNYPPQAGGGRDYQNRGGDNYDHSSRSGGSYRDSDDDDSDYRE